MNALSELQKWYFAQCDGDWEHSYGVKIDTLDNPGWTIEIDLVGTNLSERTFEERSYGTGSDAEASGNEWLFCKVANDKFIASGGPDKLEEMINVFLIWARSAA